MNLSIPPSITHVSYQVTYTSDRTRVPIRITQIANPMRVNHDPWYYIWYSPKYDRVGRSEKIQFHGDHFTSNAYPGKKLLPEGELQTDPREFAPFGMEVPDYRNPTYSSDEHW